MSSKPKILSKLSPSTTRGTTLSTPLLLTSPKAGMPRLMINLTLYTRAWVVLNLFTQYFYIHSVCSWCWQKFNGSSRLPPSLSQHISHWIWSEKRERRKTLRNKLRKQLLEQKQIRGANKSPWNSGIQKQVVEIEIGSMILMHYFDNYVVIRGTWEWETQGVRRQWWRTFCNWMFFRGIFPFCCLFFQLFSWFHPFFYLLFTNLRGLPWLLIWSALHFVSFLLYALFIYRKISSYRRSILCRSVRIIYLIFFLVCSYWN